MADYMDGWMDGQTDRMHLERVLNQKSCALKLGVLSIQPLLTPIFTDKTKLYQTTDDNEKVLNQCSR